MRKNNLLILILLTIFITSISAVSAADILVLHRTDKDCATDQPLPNINNGLEQVFEVGVDAGYGNYQCTNRKQEQCYDDGTFDHYYYEWCETIPIPSQVTCNVGQIIGDVSGNGQVTAGDAKLLNRVIAGTVGAPENICCLDVNQDGAYNVGDSIVIQRIGAGLDASPGVCTATQDQADLKAESVSITTEGDNLYRVNYCIKNNGNAEAYGLLGKVYNEENGWVLATSATGTLNAGATICPSAIVGTGPFISGSNTIKLMVDPDYQISESDESNNIKTVEFQYATNTCLDSDGGISLFTQGETTGVLGGSENVWLNGQWHSPGALGTFQDSCSNTDSDWVTELYCSGNAIQTTQRFCSNGCQSGACRQEGSATQTFTLPANQWSWISFNVLPTSRSITEAFGSALNSLKTIKTGDGDDEKVYDASQSRFEISTLQYEKSYKVYTTSAVTFTVRGEKPRFTRSTNLKKYDSSSNFNYIGYPYEIQSSVENFFAPIMDVIEIVKGPNGFYIPGVMTNSLTTLKPGEGYTIAVKKDTGFTFTADPNQQMKYCSDSDGGKNYNIKGTTEGYYQGTYIDEQDSCLLNNDPDNLQSASQGAYLGELYCETETHLNFEIYKCPYSCQDGRCITSNVEGADLAIDGIRVTPTNVLDEQGRYQVTLNAVVKNYGTEASGNYDVSYYVDGRYMGAGNGYHGLAPGESEGPSNIGGGSFYYTGTHTVEFKLTPYGNDANSYNNQMRQSFTVGNANNLQPVYFVVDEYAPAEDVRQLSQLVAHMEPLDQGSKTKLNKEVTRADLKNRLTVFIYKGQGATIVGQTAPASDVQLAAKAQRYMESTLGLRVKSLIDTQVYSDDLRTVFENVDPTATCTDYDRGKDYYTSSYVKVSQTNGLSKIQRDYCASENTLNEYYCSGADSALISYECRYGCDSGACRSSPAPDNKQVKLDSKFSMTPGSTAQVVNYHNMEIKLNHFLGSTITPINPKPVIIETVSPTASVITARVVDSSSSGGSAGVATATSTLIAPVSISGGSGGYAVPIKTEIKPIAIQTGCQETYKCPDGTQVPYCHKVYSETVEEETQECTLKYSGGITNHPGSYQTILSKEHDYILRFWNGHDENGRGRGLSGIYFPSGGYEHANAHMSGFSYSGAPYDGHWSGKIDVPTDTWTRVSMEYTGETLGVFFGGEAVASTEVSKEPLHSNYDLYIGSHVGGRDGFYGQIDEVTIVDLETGETVLLMNFDEGSGSVAKDTSGNGLNGEIKNAKWVSGRTGKALEFNGNSYVRIPDNVKLEKGKFRVDAWIRIPSRGVEVCGSSSGGGSGGVACVCRVNPESQCPTPGTQGVNIDVTLPSETTESSIILHRDHLYCSNDQPVEYSPNGGLDQVFPVGEGTNYWNFRCQNRKQEQCYDDGSFDTYYREWCEYPESSTTTANVDLLLGKTRTVFGADITLVDLSKSTATFIVSKESDVVDTVDIGIMPRTQTVNEGAKAEYDIVVKDTRAVMRCEGNTRCGQVPKTYDLSVIGLPFDKSLDSSITLNAGEMKELKLIVYTNRAVIEPKPMEPIGIEADVAEILIKFKDEEEATQWCVKNIATDSTSAVETCVNRAMIAETTEAMKQTTISVSPTASVITGNIVADEYAKEHSMDNAESAEVAIDRVLPQARTYRFAVKVKSRDGASDVAYGTLRVEKKPDYSQEYAVVIIYEEIRSDIDTITARAVSENVAEPIASIRAPVPEPVPVLERRIVGKFYLPKGQAVYFEDEDQYNYDRSFKLYLTDVRDAETALIQYSISGREGYSGSVGVKEGQQVRFGSSNYIMQVVDVVEDGVTPPPLPDEIEEKVTLNLHPGWNLVSLSGNKLTRFISTDCSTPTNKLVAFVYLKDQKKYVTLTQAMDILGDEFNDYLSRTAFWIYSYSECSLKVGVETYLGYNELSLSEGWNMVPVTKDMIGQRIGDLTSDCDFTSLYIWDSNEFKWKTITTEYNFNKGMEYKGFIAKTTGYCQLGGSLTILVPPEFPAQSAS